MKRTWKCPKCSNQNIGYFSKLHDHGGSEASRPRKLSIGSESRGPGLLAGRNVFTAEVEAFVCTDCGYFEEYVSAPQEVQWEKLDNFRWCKH